MDAETIKCFGNLITRIARLEKNVGSLVQTTLALTGNVRDLAKGLDRVVTILEKMQGLK